MLFSMVALCFYVRAYAHAAFSSWVCGAYPLLNQNASTTTTIVIIGMVFGNRQNDTVISIRFLLIVGHGVGGKHGKLNDRSCWANDKI